MFGKNKILGLRKGDGNMLEVNEIFATFQGEACFTGYPSIFIRLAGCNLSCNFCDTEFDKFQELSLDDILLKINELNINNFANLIVITGGEPMRQPIEKLCEKLIDLGFLIQIETNGTIYRKLPKGVKIICSPKISNGKYSKIRDDLLKRVTAFKFIISKNHNYSIIPDIGQDVYKTPVYLQPMDEYNKQKNEENMNFVLRLAKEKGCRISLQSHKVWNID
ncbi:7-carboxy-7-deazaguanine synthase QueE [Rickettsiales bacterium]|nr:7-carboxy-7-deazaguanine synthase QueE [Rickettsiales bacterium]